MVLRLSVKHCSVNCIQPFATAVLPIKKSRYFPDTRRIGKRHQYGDIYMLQDGQSIRFEIANENDTELVAERFIDGFLKHSSILKALNAKRKDLDETMIYDMTQTMLLCGGTLLGFRENKLACFRMIRYIQHDKLSQTFGSLSKFGDPPPVAMFPADYGTLIDAIPYGSFAARVMAVMVAVPERRLGKFLPLDVTNLAFGQAVTVHRDFQKTFRHGLGTHICALSEKLAIENGCNYIANITVAAASSRIAAKKGFKVLYSMPYDKFYVHGKLIFENLSDGATASNLNLGKLV